MCIFSGKGLPLFPLITGWFVCNCKEHTANGLQVFQCTAVFLQWQSGCWRWEISCLCLLVRLWIFMFLCESRKGTFPPVPSNPFSPVYEIKISPLLIIFIYCYYRLSDVKWACATNETIRPLAHLSYSSSSSPGLRRELFPSPVSQVLSTGDARNYLLQAK